VAVLIPIGEGALRRLMPIARTLRQEGLPVELAYGDRKLPRELERANRLGARYAVIVGDTELGRGQAVIRDMQSRQQRPEALERLAGILRDLAVESGRGEG
jgi:histidyl-tRNA synthetase